MFFAQKPQKDNFTTAYEPDYAIEERIGKETDLSKIFTSERLAASQQVIERSKQWFFKEINDEMHLLEQSLTLSIQATESETIPLESIAYHAHNIYGQAQILGFPMIVRLCKFIVGHCEDSAFTKPFSLPSKKISPTKAAQY